MERNVSRADPFGWKVHEQSENGHCAQRHVALSGAPGWQPIPGKYSHTCGEGGLWAVLLCPPLRRAVHPQSLPLTEVQTESWGLVSCATCPGYFLGYLTDTQGDIPWGWPCVNLTSILSGCLGGLVR